MINSKIEITSWPLNEKVDEEIYNKRIYWPKISIVTPSFNQGQYIEETILSVLNQNYPNLEYIIIDGGSTDNTVEIIKKYETSLSYWESKKDHGQTHAINKGFEKATGDILAYLNSDDCYYPKTLYIIAEEYIEANDPSSKLMFVGKAYVGDKINQTGIGHIMAYNSSEWNPLRISCGFGVAPQPSVFWTKNNIRFDESLQFAMDFDYWYKLTANDYTIVKKSEILSYYRIHNEAKGNTIQDKMWNELTYLTIKHLQDFKCLKEQKTLLSSFNYKLRFYLISIIKKHTGEWKRKDLLELSFFLLKSFPGVVCNRLFIKFLLKRIIINK